MNHFKKYREKMEQLKDEIIELLKSHPDKYISGDVIVETIGLKGKTQLRGLVNKMRKDGIPIIAGNSGYKYTEDVNEITIYGESLYCRANDMMEAYRGIERYLIERRYDGNS